MLSGAASWGLTAVRGALCIFQGQGLAVSHGVPRVRRTLTHAPEFCKTLSCIPEPRSWVAELGSVPAGPLFF